MSDKDGPWTPDDIRQNAPSWSLHCDGKLLEYMQHLSKTIEERGKRTNYNMHSSMLQLDQTKVTLENATNQLMALQNKQFVENRVYDDDETLANVENVPTTDPGTTNKPKPSIIEALHTSIETGIKLMDKYYDRVTVEFSDSEDDDGEEVEKNIIFRPKDPYQHRPLPYLIGSKEWHEKWHIGLEEDEESDESDNENADDASISSSPALSVSSNVPVSLSESENPTGVIPSRKSGSQDLFQSSSEENVSRLAHETAETTSTFHKQVNEPSKIDPNAKQFDPREINARNSIFRPQKMPTTSHVIPTLIDSDPPELDDTPNIRTPHKPANLFLDDENDPDDFNIFDDKNASVKRDNDQKIAAATKDRTKSINLFADDDSDNFDFLPSTSKTTANTNVKRPEPNVTNLFDDDDEDELFLHPSEPSITRTPRSTILANAPKKDVFICNLFDDEPPEDDFLTTATTKAVQSISNIPSNNTATESKTKKSSDLFNKMNLFDDDDDEDDGFEQLITPTKKETPKPQSKSEINFMAEIDDTIDKIDKKPDELVIKKPEKSKLVDPMRLFGDEPPSDDEQLFSSKKSGPIKTSEQNKENKEVNLNIESEKSNKIDTKSTPQKTVKSNVTDPIRLFDDTPPSDDDEQLFSSAPSTSTRQPQTKEKSIESTKQSTGVFYNDFSDTITSIPKPMETKKSVNLFNDEESTDKKQPVEEKQSKIESKSAEITGIDGIDGSKDEKRSDFLKKIDAFSNAASGEQKPESTSPQKMKPPKKLNIGNIDINVAALLPGAKRSKSIEKSDISNEDLSDDRKSDDQLSPLADKSTISKVVSQDNVDSSGRLVNLNRSRAKNLSRRPSTRAGRKQQYQKSIDTEDQIVENFEKIDDADFGKTSDAGSDKTDNVKPENIEKVLVPALNNSNLTKSKTKSVDGNMPAQKILQKSPEIETFPSEKDSKSSESETEPLKLEQSPKMEISPKTVLDRLKTESDSPQTKVTFEDDLFESDTSPKITIEPKEIVVKLPSFLDEPIDQDEDPFAFLNEQGDENDDFFSAKSTGEEANPSADYNVQNTMSVKATPAYIDELPPDLDADDEKPFGGTIDKITSLMSQNSLSLFGDDDDDDDFDNDGIFSSGGTPSQTALPKLEDDIPKVDDDWSPYPSIPEKISPPNDKKPTSNVVDLFDDDLNAEDIFGTKATTSSKPLNEPKIQKKPVAITSPASASKKMSLFGDDDDDDLFGGPSETVKKPIAEPSKQTKPKKADTKIFSDDSSDDELFGGSKIKKNPPKHDTTTVKSVVRSKESKPIDKLFSDSESDDGDLFGSKPKQIVSKKSQPASTSKVSKDEQSKTTKTLSPSAVNNDPLADLLK